MAKVLFIRSDWDLPTKYLATYAKLLVDYAIQQGHQVTDLYNDVPNASARLLDFEREMANQPDIIIITGHANEKIQTVQDNELLLKVGVNDDIMSGKTIYLPNCSTGVELGPSMVSKTAQQYYGFIVDFTFIYHPDFYSQGKILEDPWAKAFFDCLLTTGYAILLGKSPLNVYEETLRRYDYWWDFWIKQNDPMADDILTWLNWNKRGFIAITPDGIYSKPKALSLSLGNIALPLGLAAFSLLLLSKNIINDSTHK